MQEPAQVGRTNLQNKGQVNLNQGPKIPKRGGM